MKVVINTCYGGFSVSKEVYDFMGLEWDGWGFYGNRTNPKLIEAIETLGTEIASGSMAKLKIVEVPDDVNWKIEEYDGKEWIAEKHRTWS